MPSRAIRAAEFSSYILGGMLTGFFVVQLAQGEDRRVEGIESFQRTTQPHHVEQAMVERAPFDLAALDDPDMSLWAPGRIDDYRASLDAELPEVLGVLEIDAVDLEVPIYANSSELVMDRGAGIIDGMAYPHEPGNIGISGHRDGYFRVLKDVEPGDRITLQTLEGEKHFRIDRTRVVEKTDTSVLQDTDDQTVTLVTCYPFYFVGSAPKRFIVTATLDTTYVNQTIRRN